MNDIVPYFTGAIGSVGGLIAVLTPFWKKFRSLSNLIDDWQGEAARPGVPGRKGVMVRLQEIEERVSRTEKHVRVSSTAGQLNIMSELKNIKEMIENGKQP